MCKIDDIAIRFDSIEHRLQSIEKNAVLHPKRLPHYISENKQVINKNIAAINKKMTGKNGKVGYALVTHRAFSSQDHLDVTYKSADFIRYATLEMLAREITEKSVGGEMAEVGVYRGDFAQALSALFPMKKLYLFDTFEGFTEEDRRIELENTYSKADQDFTKTSVDYVLEQMTNRESCVVMKGRFPDTAEGIDCGFCLVSLDCDLYQPTYEGLKFFYPRLSSGGYIIVHDYSSYVYLGVKKAVRQFSEENGVPFSVIPDACGSAIISK